MKLLVRPSKLSGRVRAPPSKSYTHRAFIIAALAEGESSIKNPLLSLDTEATIEGIRTLGAKVTRKGNVWFVKGTGGDIRAKGVSIDAKNSGTTLRLLTGVASLSPDSIRLTGDVSLSKRPMGELIRALAELGAKARCEGPRGRPPVVVGGGLRGGDVEITGAVSSQFISALLISAARAKEDVTIRVIEELRSRPYIEITLELLKKAGVNIKHSGDLRTFKIRGQQKFHPIDIEIPGDFSSAAFILGAGAITGSEIEITNLDYRTPQGDKRIVNFLREFGAEVKVLRDSVGVRGEELSGCEFDCADTPDLVPVLAVLGSVAEGNTEIFNVPHLRVKESDRIKSLAAGLKRFGAKVEELADGLRLRGVEELRGCEVDSYGDHRIAMAFAIAGLAARGETKILGAESILVSYPSFVEDLQELGAKIRKVPG